MRIWIVTVGEPLPIDGEAPRLFRSGELATRLAKLGNQVVWWTSDFDHYAKRSRFRSYTKLCLQSGVDLRLLHGCGYTRNVSLQRLLDHVQIARQFRQIISGEQQPHVIVASLPTIELAASAVAYGKQRGVPVVIDVRDLWPDIFLARAPRALQALLRPALTFLDRQAMQACRDATAIMGNSPGMVAWGVRKGGRTISSNDRHFPFVYDTTPLTAADAEAGFRFWAQIGIERDPETLICCFFGTIGPHFDFEPFIEAAERLEASGLKLKVVFCGAGDLLDGLKRRARGVRSVYLPGWIDRIRIRTLMDLADVGLAPFRNHVGFLENLTNKPVEYLSGGLPIVSTLNGYLARFLQENDCGITVNGDVTSITQTLRTLAIDRTLLHRLRRNARMTFENHFQAERVYGDMIKYISSFTQRTS